MTEESSGVKTTLMVTDRDIHHLIEFTVNRQLTDKYRGRSTWVKRWMFLHLLCATRLSVRDIAGIKVGDLHINGKGANSLKTRKGIHIILEPELVEHIREFMTVKQVRGEPLDDGAYFLTPSLSGKAYSQMGLLKQFKTMVAEADLPDITVSEFLSFVSDE